MGERIIGKQDEMALLVANMNGTTYAELGRRYGHPPSRVRDAVLRLRESIGMPVRVDGRQQLRREEKPPEPTEGCALFGCTKKATGRSKYCSVPCRVKNAHRRRGKALVEAV